MKKGKFNASVLLFVSGLFLLSAGVYSFMYPFDAYLVMIKYAGTVVLISSIIHFLFALIVSKDIRETEWLLTESGLDFIFSVILLFNPFLTFMVFPLIFGLWIGVSGLLKISAGLFMKGSLRKPVPVIIAGIILFCFGLLVFFGPYQTVGSISVVFGIFGGVIGVLYLYDAVRFHVAGNTMDYLV